MKVRFIGDTHEPERWARLRAGAKLSIHVGDVALAQGRGTPPKPEKGHWFIRGNKDEIGRCNKREDFLGDFGYFPKLNLYFISGAASVENKMPMEELSERAFSEAFYEILALKPDVIVSHDAPFVTGVANWQGNTFTNRWLDKIFLVYQPKLWVFGHHHIDFKKNLAFTRFAGIGKYQTVEFDL